jgi:hypothetical protein
VHVGEAGCESPWLVAKLTAEERDLMIAWRVTMGHRSMYEETVDPSELEPRRMIGRNTLHEC